MLHATNYTIDKFSAPQYLVQVRQSTKNKRQQVEFIWQAELMFRTATQALKSLKRLEKSMRRFVKAAAKATNDDRK